MVVFAEGTHPVSMPNPAVKSSSADGTAGGTRGRVGRRQKPFFFYAFKRVGDILRSFEECCRLSSCLLRPPYENVGKAITRGSRTPYGTGVSEPLVIGYFPFSFRRIAFPSFFRFLQKSRFLRNHSVPTEIRKTRSSCFSLWMRGFSEPFVISPHKTC